MSYLRIAPSVLMCFSVLALGACGNDDSTTTAAPTTKASPTTTSQAGGKADGDEKVCKSAHKAAGVMTRAVIKAVMTGEDAASERARRALKAYDSAIGEIVADASDSAVTSAAKATAAEAAKAAAASDPMAAAEDPSFEAAGDKLTAACKDAGVDVKF